MGREETLKRIAHLDTLLVGDMTPAQEAAHYKTLDALLDALERGGW